MTREKYDQLVAELQAWRDVVRLQAELRRCEHALSDTSRALHRVTTALGVEMSVCNPEWKIERLTQKMEDARKTLPRSKCPWCPTMTPGGFACESCKQDMRDDPDSFK